LTEAVVVHPLDLGPTYVDPSNSELVHATAGP